MIASTLHALIFDHMVELPNCECVFCSTREEDTRRVRIFLVFKERRKIYMRNGLRGNWEEIIDNDEHEMVWEGFERAVLERRIPSFVSSSMMFAGV